MTLKGEQDHAVFDPFANSFDPDAKPFDPNSKQFNPDVSPFEPNTTSNKPVLDLSSWQVVAAEYSGKAVAVLLSPSSTLHVCTSPSFNSKCDHPGLACLDWETVDLGKGRSATPEPRAKSLHDSGVENFTDNSSEDIEKINMVAKWSAEASRHAEEWSADVTAHDVDWSAGVTAHGVEWSEGVSNAPQEWSEDVSGQMWSADHPPVEWSVEAGNVWPVVQSDEFQAGTAGYHVTVEYHGTEDLGYHQGTDDIGYHLGTEDNGYLNHGEEGGYQLSEGYHQTGEDYQSQVEEAYTPRPCYGNDPVVVYQPWGSSSVANDTWSSGLGINMAGLSLEKMSPDQEVDQDKIREEFKRKISCLIGGIEGKEVDEEAKIREEFKKKILSNLILSENDTSEDKIKEAFRRQVLSNLKEAAVDATGNDICDEDKIREAFKKQILSNL